MSSSNSQLRTGNESGQLQLHCHLAAAAQKPPQLDGSGSGRGGTSDRQSSNNRSAAGITTSGAEGATYEAVDPLAAAQQLNACNKSRGASVSQSDNGYAAEEQRVSRCVPLRRFGFFFRSSHGGSSGGSSNKHTSSSANTATSAASNNLASSFPADATPPLAAKSGNSGNASSLRGSRKNRRNRGSNGDADGNASVSFYLCSCHCADYLDSMLLFMYSAIKDIHKPVDDCVNFAM